MEVFNPKVQFYSLIKTSGGNGLVLQIFKCLWVWIFSPTPVQRSNSVRCRNLKNICSPVQPAEIAEKRVWWEAQISDPIATTTGPRPGGLRSAAQPGHNPWTGSRHPQPRAGAHPLSPGPVAELTRGPSPRLRGDHREPGSYTSNTSVFCRRVHAGCESQHQPNPRICLSPTWCSCAPCFLINLGTAKGLFFFPFCQTQTYFTGMVTS